MPEPFVLPSSKLMPPRLGVALMARPQLLDEVQRGLLRRLVLLTAEAGYGKTCALISALRGATRPVAWLALDERDTDPSLFGAGVVLALQRVTPTVGKRALEVLAGGPSVRTIETTLLSCLGNLRRRRTPNSREGGVTMIAKGRNLTAGKRALFALLLMLTPAGNVLAQSSRIDQAILDEPDQKAREVSTDELKRILASKSAVVLDTRPHREFAMSHIPGAQNVAPKPGVPISMYVSDVKEVERLVNGDKGKPLVLYCNGPFCGKSKRLSEELLAAGFTNVRRYQLGIPVWRALVGLAEIELDGVQYVLQHDRTAVFLDARNAEEFNAGSLPGARNIPQSVVEPGKDVGEVRRAKDDGRLPMEDHNTRIVVFGRDATQARALAEAIAREAFHNVAYFPGQFDALRIVVK